MHGVQISKLLAFSALSGVAFFNVGCRDRRPQIVSIEPVATISRIHEVAEVRVRIFNDAKSIYAEDSRWVSDDRTFRDGPSMVAALSFFQKIVEAGSTVPPPAVNNQMGRVRVDILMKSGLRLGCGFEYDPPSADGVVFALNENMTTNESSRVFYKVKAVPAPFMLTSGGRLIFRPAE